MSEQAKPVLSIGIIFKDDIRCIKRCLEALQPLRDALACELVMADTGSEDGSREVAEKYADVLIDFPWIDDFAAARNAVVERCSGEWYLAIDTDEYLDGNISELLELLGRASIPENLFRLNIRNHKTYTMDGAYADFYTLRLLRLLPGVRYEGAIHESWVGINPLEPITTLANTILHHDGYVDMDHNTEKLKRNITLLRKKLKANPQNLLVWLQTIESAIQEEDYRELLRKAVKLLKRKPARWMEFGPPILRWAVIAAQKQQMPEFQKWVEMAREWFPNSYFTRIDVAAYCIWDAYEKGDFAACVRQGGSLLDAYADYRAGRGDMDCQIYSTLHLPSPYHEQFFFIVLAVAFVEEGLPEKALALLERLDYTLLDETQTKNLTKALCDLQSKSALDTTSLIMAVWEGIYAPGSDGKRAEECRRSFILTGSTVFSAGYQNEETEKNQRHAYTIFAPLAGKCSLGTAAAILGSEDPNEIEALLSEVEQWIEFPFPAVSHAIEKGVLFPLPDKPLKIEEMDSLARGLSGDWETLFTLIEIAAARDFSANWQDLSWGRALALAAVQNCRWEDEKQGLALAKTFSKVEGTFVSRCYAPEILRDENIHILPSMHRFGWYCGRAFDALEGGDTAGYVRLLRRGLETCPQMKPMVEFLTEHTPQLQTSQADAELLALADQVRTLLSAYPADDPAVVALKQSPVYQRVADLIEAREIPGMKSDET